MPDKPFLVLEKDVTVDLGDGVERPLRFSIRTLRRIQTRIGRPTMGRRSILMDLDESLLPEIVYEGLCDENGLPPELADGKELTLDTILSLPSSSIRYLSMKLIEAYTQSVPEPKPEKKDPTAS